MLKKGLIAIGVLVLLLVAAAVALVTLVDVDRFKPQIQQFVADRYQRTLTIDGALSLSVVPRIALTLPAMTLSEPRTATPAARLAGARVAVALWPLLRGEVIADKIAIDGLDARIERRADGSTSIDDLLGGTAGAPPGQSPASSQSPPQSTPQSPSTSQSPAGTSGGKPMALPRFDIGGIALTNARIELVDRAAAATTTVERLSLETGRLANRATTPLKLAADVAATQPKLAARLSLRAEADYDLDAGRFGVRGLDATAAGQYADQRFDARIGAPQLVIGADAASGDTVTAVVKLAGTAPGAAAIEAKLDASGLGGRSGALTIAKLAIDATLAQPPRKVVAQLATPVAGNLDTGSWQLAGLTGTVTIDDPGIANGSARIELAGRASADTEREQVRADLNAKAEGSTLTAKLSVDDFAKPRLGVELDADRLDVDRFIAPAPAKPPAPASRPANSPPAAGSPAASPPAASSPAAGSPAPATGAAAAADDAIDLSGLRTLTLNGRVAIGQLRASGLQASDLKVTLKAADGRLVADPIAAGFYQGRLAGSASVLAGATPAANRVTLNADLAGVAIGPLLRDLADRDLLTGRGNVRLALQTGGAGPTAMTRALGGTAAVALRDGAIKGINLGETIRQARGLLQRGSSETRRSDDAQQTDFTELNVTFAIRDGIASSNDLDAKSPLLRIGGEGRADLPARRLDYTVRASVVGTSAGQGGRELDELRGVTIPVRLTGPFDAPDWQIDWATAGREALKSRAAAELKDRLKSEQLEEKAKERIGDALKGLLRR
ncbi:MAG: AsmA family protein [Lautropia sp.]